jgi:hypothetical protein
MQQRDQEDGFNSRPGARITNKLPFPQPDMHMAMDTHRTRTFRKHLVNGLAAGLFAAAIFRWWFYVDAYSVNLLVWDQWDLYDAFFEPHGWLDLFRWQHGPHRQGAGFFLTKLVAELSGWNTRVEAFAIASVIFLAMLGALGLKRRLTGSFGWPDTAIGLLFLTPLQYAVFASVPNPSHGTVPLFLLILYCASWTLRTPAMRYPLVLVLNLMLIYTGFGLLAGLFTPILLAADYVARVKAGRHRARIPLLTAITIALLSAASFFVGYEFIPTVPNFQFPIAEHWQYPVFVVMMLANFCGIKGAGMPSVLTGTLVLILMLAVCSWHCRRMVVPLCGEKTAAERSNVNRLVFVLTGFTLLFCALTAVGRVGLGLNAAQASRYVPYLIPGFFGLYLHLAVRPEHRLKPWLQAAVVIGLVAATTPLRAVDRQTVEWLSQSKKQWKRHYLQTGNIEQSNRAARFMIYPDAQRTHLEEKLLYLKSKRLNLFQDS